MLKSFMLAALVCTMTHVAHAQDVCSNLAVAAVVHDQKANEVSDRGYTFDGISGVDEVAAGTFDVSFSYNDECIGGYTVKTQKSADGRSCRIIEMKTDDTEGACG